MKLSSFQLAFNKDGTETRSAGSDSETCYPQFRRRGYCGYETARFGARLWQLSHREKLPARPVLSGG